MKIDPLPILLVIDSFGSGGAQRQIITLANGLVKLDQCVHLFVYFPHLDHYRNSIDKRVVLHEIEKKNKLGINVILKLRELLIQYKYQSAIAFLNTPSFYLELASILTQCKTKVFYSERSSIGLNKPSVIANIRKKLHKICFKITSNSMVQTELLKLVYGSEKVSYIPNAMPEKLFKILKNKSAFVKKQYVVVAHTTVFKNYRYIADSLIKFKEIYQTTPPVINWYGRIICENDISNLLNELDSHGLKNCLIFHGVTNKVDELLENAYFLIHPSKFESSSNSVAEALSTSTPVMLGDISDHQLIIDDSKSGYVFRLSHPEDLAEKLYFSEKMEEREYLDISKNARAYAFSNYQPVYVIKKYFELLKQ